MSKKVLFAVLAVPLVTQQRSRVKRRGQGTEATSAKRTEKKWPALGPSGPHVCGPTHSTRTGVWVSHEDTPSSFKRRETAFVVVVIERWFRSRVTLVARLADSHLSIPSLRFQFARHRFPEHNVVRILAAGTHARTADSD